MQKELIQAAAGLFPTFEHWQSFLELSQGIDSIKNYWFVEATTTIRRHFMETLSPDWCCDSWGSPDRDTRWFLKEFGPESLGITYGWYYQLHLRFGFGTPGFKTELVSRLLKEKGEYRPIHLAFERIDPPYQGSLLAEIGNFRFGSAYDGNFALEDKDGCLGWYASHRLNEFVDQAVKKVERFTNTPEVTKLIRKLNQAAIDARSPNV
jgi:hypothetical protein